MKMTFIFLFLFQFSVFAQCDSSDIVELPDVDASFHGGNVELLRFVQGNIELPEVEFCSMGLTGIIYLTFIICDDGSIQDIQIERSHNNRELEKIAIDVIEKMPNWIPAKVNDIPVASRVRLPLRIYLE